MHVGTTVLLTLILCTVAQSSLSGDILTFGGEAGAWVVLKEGDKINSTPEAGSTCSSIIYF